jgi:iron(III) transport system ATP-binding protein
MGTHVRVADLRKAFPTARGQAFHALAGIDLDIPPGTFCVLVGDSGSGKTTLLRCVAGLEQADSGEITLGARTVFSSRRGVFVPASERPIGMVFQSYAIWPHLSVAENVSTPLMHGRRKLAREAATKRVADVLAAVGLADLADRPAPRLSGGQQQRVALARALAVTSELLLMDEPMSNLDARLREEVRAQLRAIAREFGTTVLYVTHDQEEAMSLADEIVLLRGGRVLQRGAPAELYDDSASLGVAKFFGPINALPAHAVLPDGVQTSIGKVKVAAVSVVQPGFLVAIRPERVRVNVQSTVNTFAAVVQERVYLGAIKHYRMRIGEVVFRVDCSDELRTGDHVTLTLPVDDLRVFQGEPE